MEKFVRKNTKQLKQSGHCSPCLSILNSLCYKHVKETKTFYSYSPKEISQPFMQKWKPNLFTPVSYIPTSVPWKKGDPFQQRRLSS